MTKDEQLLKAFTTKRLLSVLNLQHFNQKNAGVPRDLIEEDINTALIHVIEPSVFKALRDLILEDIDNAEFEIKQLKENT